MTTMPAFVREIEQELRVPGRWLPGHSVIEKREKRELSLSLGRRGGGCCRERAICREDVDLELGAAGQGVGPGSRRRAIQGTRIRNT